MFHIIITLIGKNKTRVYAYKNRGLNTYAGNNFKKIKMKFTLLGKN